jgi:hypothetical protein
LKREQEENKKRQKGLGKKSPFSIKKEGLQVILISDFHTPGAGKTSLLNYLTGAAKDKMGKFTPIPEVGIYNFKKIRFQIVDMPALQADASKGIGNGKEILSQVRSCDLLCLIVDLSRNTETQMKLMLDELSNSDVRLNVTPPPITIEKTGSNKIQVFYLTKEAKNNEDIDDLTEKVKEIIKENGVRNGIVKIRGKISLIDVVDALSASVVYKKALIICTKGDLPHTSEVFETLKRKYSNEFPIIIGTSVHKNTFPNDFGDIIVEVLNKIKVYTRNAGKIADKPLIIDKESTVKDVALKIHRSFYELFDHAIVVRDNARQQRKKVGLDYKLEDQDIIELHTI